MSLYPLYHNYTKMKNRVHMNDTELAQDAKVK